MVQGASSIFEKKSHTFGVSITINCAGCGKTFSGKPQEVWKKWIRHFSNCDLGLEELKWDIARAEVLKRDNYTCQNCGKHSFMDLHIHHRVFRSHGGEDTKNNLVTLCRNCHGRRHQYHKKR